MWPRADQKPNLRRSLLISLPPLLRAPDCPDHLLSCTVPRGRDILNAFAGGSRALVVPDAASPDDTLPRQVAEGGHDGRYEGASTRLCPERLLAQAAIAVA